VNRTPVSYEHSDKFVSDQRSRGVDVRWDGFTMVFWKQNSEGFVDKNGAFRDGAWGIQTKVAPNTAGIWNVPIKCLSLRS
jgi:hypothetical protein